MEAAVDVFVVGGGINGAAVARDAAGRGLKVQLAEMGDFASATSSASSKLIHGGIRYLEQYEFRLVREALHERETMLKIAPHLVTPLRFLLPVTRGQPRPAWMVRLGLLLYDLMSGRQRLEATGRLSADEREDITELRQDDVRTILHYPDCWVDDARLVLATLLDARDRGAQISNYCDVTRLEPLQDGYRVHLRGVSGVSETVRARCVVNAAGPWADQLLGRVGGRNASPVKLRLVRGSHLVIAAPPAARPEAYTLQNDDGRVVFVIPWHPLGPGGPAYRVIGTTDAPHDGAPDDVACSDAERDYLLAAYNGFFTTPITQQDIVWTWSGVRPLVDDGADNPSHVSRDYRLETERAGSGMLLSVFGGKLTSHRLLGEKVMRALEPVLDLPARSWTANAPLWGGQKDRAALEAMWRAGPASVRAETRQRWAFTYGAQAQQLYEAAIAEGAPRVGTLYAAELDHARDVEMAKRPEDFLYRRTKLFLGLDATTQAALQRYFGTDALSP